MDRDNLIEHIRAHSCPMEPLPTGEAPLLTPLTGLKAVIFDIYGTLFISGSGDISLAEAEDRGPAICAALETSGFRIERTDEDWSGALLKQIEAFRRRRMEAGVAYPEVRIEEVWHAFVERAGGANWLSGNGDIELAIVDHECRVNPCWPMDGLASMLDACRGAGLRMGIVSNAQFYTPLLFPALLGTSLADLGIEEALSVWSYREREGKPSKGLYERLKDLLAQDQIAPEEVLYIGNDRRNDIWPAGACGFKTGLFAGDKRSLRWRKEDPDCQSVQPDRVLTHWSQLADSILPQS